MFTVKSLYIVFAIFFFLALFPHTAATLTSTPLTVCLFIYLFNYEMPLLYFLESSDTSTRKWSYPSLPLYIHNLRGRGCRGGMYRDPACSLKLNRDNSEDTSRCISTDTHDMHSKKTSGNAVTPGSHVRFVLK